MDWRPIPPNYPEWRKQTCVHCAAEMPESAQDGYHWERCADPTRVRQIAGLLGYQATAKCEALQ